MGRYLGPKGRINRRLGALIFEDAGSSRALENRNQPPGMHGRRRKISNYGLAFMEKQKIKFYYGLRDKHVRNYYTKARRFKGNTGQHLLILCECRLDNVVRRSGLTTTRPQARQGIVHKHFQVNGKTVDRPSYQVKAGDVITVRNRPNLKRMYKDVVESSATPHCDWISFDSAGLTARVTQLPTYDDVSLHVDVGAVVAFLSR